MGDRSVSEFFTSCITPRSRTTPRNRRPSPTTKTVGACRSRVTRRTAPGTGSRRDESPNGLHDARSGQNAGPVDILHGLGNIVVRRVGQDVFWRSHLHDMAVAHDRDPVSEEHGLVEVMGDEDDGLAELRLQLDELLLHLVTDERIQCRERLVHQHDLCVCRKRAGETPVLLHSAGKLAGELVFPALETDPLRDAEGALSALGQGNPLYFEAVCGHIEYGAVRCGRSAKCWKTVEMPRRRASRTSAGAGDVDAVDGHRSGCRLDEFVEHTDERGLDTGSPNPRHGSVGSRSGFMF